MGERLKMLKGHLTTFIFALILLGFYIGMLIYLVTTEIEDKQTLLEEAVSNQRELLEVKMDEIERLNCELEKYEKALINCCSCPD